MRTRPRARRALSALVAGALIISGTLIASSAANAIPQGNRVIPENPTMAAIGDSITQAATTCTGLYRCGENSWSTGTTTSVASHATRLRTYVPELTAYNDSVSGAASDTLVYQAQKAAAQGAQYVTVAIGANDACTDTVSEMTSTGTFRANVSAALATLAAGAESPEIFVASIPSLRRVYEVNRANPRAVYVWSRLGVCPSMLADPLSILRADRERRDTVQRRVDAFNRVLADACAATANCRFDGGAVANYSFSRAEISTQDFFHPSLKGQATMARITWAATQWAS